MKESVADEINAPSCDGENLVISFDPEFELIAEVSSDLRQQLVQGCLVRRQDHQVIGVSEIIADAFLLLDPMVKTGQVEIREILAQVVPDRNARSTIDDLLEQPEQGFVFELPAKKALQNGVINGGIEFRDIQFQAVLSARLIPQCPL